MFKTPKPSKFRYYKILVSGSREFEDYDLLANQLRRIIKKEGCKPQCIIHGGAPGADALASRFAYEEKIDLDIEGAQWGTHLNRAGGIRNSIMILEKGMGKDDWVVAFPLPGSKGTVDLITKAEKYGCFQVVIVEDGNLETV
jgi:hypothetical protein